MFSNQIHSTLTKLGLKKNDVVMIHGDAIVSAQLKIKEFEEDPLNFFLNSLIDYFYPNGTIVVPAFSYCMNEDKLFDKLYTQSEVGLFSEKFRKKKNILRSNHPMFSVCAIGKYSKNLTEYNLLDCFGKNSFFDIFTKLNGKILCLGCPLERITYFHYVEQKFKVHYRYMKKFSCAFKNNDKIIKTKISYYVRDLNKNASLDFRYFTPKIRNILKVTKFGRFKFQLIEANKLLKQSKILLKKYPNILVGNKDAI